MSEWSFTRWGGFIIATHPDTVPEFLDLDWFTPASEQHAAMVGEPLLDLVAYVLSYPSEAA
jgi:hypothetical protein